MLFNSFHFLLFFLVLTVIYPLSYRLNQHKNTLLIASVFFYAYWSVKYFLLLSLSIGVTYFLGKKISRNAIPKFWLYVGICFNLLILLFFKYVDFLVDILNQVLPFIYKNNVISPFNLLLPVGISFFTFQNLSYLIDIKRKQINTAKNFKDYFLYISFFPQLIAGPIIRPKTFFSQIDKLKTTGRQQLAFFIILVGYVQKIVFASYLEGIVTPVFDNPSEYNSIETLLALYGYSFQIYFDFAGYSNIAIGIALSFGFDFPKNFNFPYVATSFKEFWSRWHISLSSWLRDYLYIPLGGNRFGFRATLRNLMITMVLGGLWHGASWNFVIWGGLHGLYLIIEKMVSKLNGKIYVPKLIRWLIVYNMVCFAWIFFRSKDIATSLQIVINISELFNSFPAFNYIGGLALLALLLLNYFLHKMQLFDKFLELTLDKQVTICSAIVLLMMFFSGKENLPFIYFQF